MTLKLFSFKIVEYVDLRLDTPLSGIDTPRIRIKFEI